MAPPGKVNPSGSSSAPIVNPADERNDLLNDQALVGDPRWSQFNFRKQHRKLVSLLNALHGYMKGTVTEDKFKEKMDAWLGSEEFSDPQDKAFNEAVVKNIYAQMGKFQSAENVSRAQKVKAAMPVAEPAPAPAPPKPAPTEPPAKGEKPEGDKGAEGDGDKNLSFGLEIQNDSLLSDVILPYVIPIDQFMGEKAHIIAKVPIEFSMGPLVGMVRPYGGYFDSKGIPGGEFGKVGSGYKLGLDLGFVNPYAQRHESAGIGIELTGVASHAGEESGIEAPGPLARLHFHRQEDWRWPLGAGRNFELGLSTIFNNQETYFPLGDENLLPEDQATPFSTASNIFAKSPYRLLSLSFRYYPNGAPERESQEDIKKPFRRGESVPKIASVVVGSMINRNRRRDIPAYANSRVFLGTFQPLGAKGSRDQFDLLGYGLGLYSFMDGSAMSTNAQLRSEIYQRGDWVDRGIMIGLDSVNLLVSGIMAASAEDDPPYGQTVEEFAANPGSVTDFEGRAAKIDTYLNLAELGLTALDASGAMGRIYDEDKTHYIVASSLALVAGIPLYFFSAPISGSECGEGGILSCGFGSPGQYFQGRHLDTGPDDIARVEKQYVISATGGALLSYGAGRLISLWLTPKEGGESPSSSKEAGNTASIPTFDVNISPDGAQLGVKGTF